MAPKHDRFPMGWLDDFKEFSGDTSAHGVKYVFHGSHKVVKILFLISWLTAIGYAMYVISNSVISFVGKPTGTKFQVIATDDDNNRPSSISFPTISVCSQNVVSKKYLEEKEGLSLIWSQLDTWDPEVTEDINFNDERFAQYRNTTYEDVVKAGGPSVKNFLQCEHTISLCSEVLGAEFVTREPSISGNCFRINPNGKLRGKGGDYGKLRLMFFADLNDYSATARTEAQYGFTVVFHDHESYSSTIPSGFWMSPGSIYKVDLSMTREYREAPPAGSCDPNLVNNTYGRYEENSCVAQCRDDAMMKSCGCVTIGPPLPGNAAEGKHYKPCTLEEWATCGMRAYKNWVTQYSDVSSMVPMCNCPPTCKEVEFKAQLSSSTLSKFYAETKVAHLPPGYSTKEDVFENLLVIEVLFTSMQVAEIKEIITYGWGNFLGDVGGVLGLFLGASAFTIIEFAQFTVFAIGKYCFGLGRKKKENGYSLQEEVKA